MSDDLSNRICSRCLVILNTTTTVSDGTTGETCSNVTNSRILRQWVEDHMWGQGHHISVDGLPYAFDPVGTWCGDAVCWAHLIEMRQREWGQFRGG